VVTKHVTKPWLNPEGGRELTETDMERMRLPRRCWEPTTKMFQASPKAMEVLRRYAATMRVQRRNGVGMMLVGPNGVGKTCLAAHYVKVYRSHGQSAMYARSSELIESSSKKIEVMGGDYDMWSFAQVCDVLLWDDLGKEHRPTSGYGAGLAERKVEDLLRARYDRRLVTFVTSNMSTSELAETYKRSTMSIMKATMLKIHQDGDDLRQIEAASDHAIVNDDFLQI
jgi:DNA replication protein DnaC